MLGLERDSLGRFVAFSKASPKHSARLGIPNTNRPFARPSREGSAGLARRTEWRGVRPHVGGAS
jgi:hypothetical protein